MRKAFIYTAFALLSCRFCHTQQWVPYITGWDQHTPIKHAFFDTFWLPIKAYRAPFTTFTIFAILLTSRNLAFIGNSTLLGLRPTREYNRLIKKHCNIHWTSNWDPLCSWLKSNLINPEFQKDRTATVWIINFKFPNSYQRSHQSANLSLIYPLRGDKRGDWGSERGWVTSRLELALQTELITARRFVDNPTARVDDMLI